MKKFISILTCFVIVFINSSVTAFAQNVESNQMTIVSEEVSQKIINYAIINFPRHIQIASHYSTEFKLPSSNAKDYILGHPFKLFSNNKLMNYDVYYFPVIYLQRIVGIFTVCDTNGELFGSFDKGFSDALEDILSKKGGSYVIAIVDGNLEAINESESILLQKGPELQADANSQRFTSLERFTADALKARSMNMVHIKTPLIQEDESQLESDPGAPYDYYNIPISVVKQPNDYWCWAATCAGIINYRNDELLSARDVVVYVKGSEVLDGGDWGDIKKAYNHWKLYPHQTTAINFDSVKTRILVNNPIHMRFRSSQYGHGMTLKGYERYKDGEDYYVVLDPYKDSAVTIRVQSAPEYIYYILAGEKLYWEYSIIDF